MTFSVGLHLALRENINPTAQSGIIIFSPFLKWFLIFFMKIGAKRPPALAGGGIAHPPLKDFT